MRIVGILSVLVAATAMAATPACAQLRQFTDWVAACDNQRKMCGAIKPNDWPVLYRATVK